MASRSFSPKLSRHFAIALTAIMLVILFVPSFAKAEESNAPSSIMSDRNSIEQTVEPREMMEEVMNTYRSFTGPIHVPMYNITYKKLYFHQGYTQLTSTCILIEAVTADRPEHIPGYATYTLGSVETWRCNYKVW